MCLCVVVGEGGGGALDESLFENVLKKIVPSLVEKKLVQWLLITTTPMLNREHKYVSEHYARGKNVSTCPGMCRIKNDSTCAEKKIMSL